jgi:hypothetical protein
MIIMIITKLPSIVTLNLPIRFSNSSSISHIF